MQRWRSARLFVFFLKLRPAKSLRSETFSSLPQTFLGHELNGLHTFCISTRSQTFSKSTFLSLPTASPVRPCLTWPKFPLITGQIAWARLSPPAFIFWFHGTDLCWKHCEVFPESPGSYFQQSPNTCFGFTKPGWQALHQFEPFGRHTERSWHSECATTTLCGCLLVHTWSQSANQQITWQQLNAFGWVRLKATCWKWSELILLRAQIWYFNTNSFAMQRSWANAHRTGRSSFEALC